MRALREFSMNHNKIRGFAAPVLSALVLLFVASACGELTGPKSPSTPTGVTATLLSGTSVMVSWTPSPLNDGVVSYSIYRNGTKVGESKTTSFTDTGLPQQQVFKYTVAANCTSGLISDQSVESAAATVTTLDVTPPTVTSHQPPTNFVGVSSAATVTATFSEAIDPTTINTSTFLVKVTSTGAAVPGTVTYTATTRVAEFKPTSPLPNPTSITATVTTGVKDLAGNKLPADFSWAFTTRDDTGPTVIATSPAGGATSVAPATPITVTFSEAMDPTTISASTIGLKVTSSGAAVAGAVSYNATTHVATFIPSATLAQTTAYTLTVAGTVKDVAGNQMATPFVVGFTTGDTIAPTVVTVSPRNDSTGVSASSAVQVAFSEAMTASTITTSTIFLTNASTSAVVPASVALNAATNTATLTPSAALAGSTTYTLTVTTGVKDLSGNSLATTFNSVFTTVTVDTTPPTVLTVSPPNLSTGVPASTIVQVAFSEPMTASTITTSTIFLTNTSTSAVVPASVAYNAARNTATLTPSAALAGSTTFTLTVTTGVKDLSGNSLATTFNSVFTTVTVDTTPPTVAAVVPASLATNVATNTTVQVTFSEAMDSSTITATNVTLKITTTSVLVPAVVVYNKATHVATLTPSSVLAFATGYTVTVTTGVKDVAGNALASPFTSTFTTVAAPDTTAPTIISRSPVDSATGVATTATPTVTFSEAMDQTTINATNVKLSVTSSSAAVAGTVTYNAATNTATFTPSSPLSNNTKYTLTVTTGVKDPAGNALAAQSTSTFTTVADTTAPTILSTSPANNATNVVVTAPVTVTFSEAMDSTTIISPATNIKLNVTTGGAVVAGTVTYNAATHVATFTPTSPLTANTNYTATVTTGVKDVAGNPLALNATFTFTTAP
jgi:thiamine monophosphate synthase